MNQNMSAESYNEAIDHIRFQLDLLKLTGMPVELTGPSIMGNAEPQQDVVRVIQELKTAGEKQHLG